MATPNTFSDKTGQIALTLLDENFEYIDTQFNSNQVKIGTSAGETNQANSGIAVGGSAGKTNQSANSIAIGFAAGEEDQGQQAVAIGAAAGQSNQGFGGVAIGSNVCWENQGQFAVAIGTDTGNINQGASAVAIGNLAGANNQGTKAIAIGENAGYSGQYPWSIAIGLDAGKTNQGQTFGEAVAIGRQAGETDQGDNGTAVGAYAGQTNQGLYATALGTSAGGSNQGDSAVAIGPSAGLFNQGDYSIAIGTNAGRTNQHANSIILNASGSSLDSPVVSSFTVKPIAELSQTASNILQYNPNTGEINYTPASIAGQVVHNVYTARTTYSVPTAGQTGTYIEVLDTSITPTRSTNKIRVEFNMSFEVHHDTILRLFRVINGVTSEVVRNNNGNYWSGFAYPGYDVDNGSTARTNHYIYIDSPNTTSAITYRLMIQSGGVGATTFYLNRPVGSAGAANYENAISQCILTEIPQ